MNLKKTVLALAVAGIAAAPMIASAAGHADGGSVYGSMRYGVQSQDAGNGTDRITEMQNFGSRFGIKGETDLGNGMTAFGQWEAHMFGGGLRDFKFGLQGDFGQVYTGDGINHAWDNLMTTDSTWWYGGSRHLTEGVQSQGITYMGSAGSVSYGLTVRLANNGAGDDNLMDQIEAVVAFDAGPVNIALGMTDAKTTVADPDAVMGLVVKGSAGGFGYAVDFQSQDDASSMQLEGTFGSFYGQYGTSDNGAANAPTPTALVLGYTQSIGANTLAYYELSNADADTAADAVSTIAAVLVYTVK
jgi:predicted porin